MHVVGSSFEEGKKNKDCISPFTKSRSVKNKNEGLSHH